MFFYNIIRSTFAYWSKSVAFSWVVLNLDWRHISICTYCAVLFKNSTKCSPTNSENLWDKRKYNLPNNKRYVKITTSLASPWRELSRRPGTRYTPGRHAENNKGTHSNERWRHDICCKPNNVHGCWVNMNCLL